MHRGRGIASGHPLPSIWVRVLSTDILWFHLKWNKKVDGTAIFTFRTGQYCVTNVRMSVTGAGTVHGYIGVLLCLMYCMVNVMYYFLWPMLGDW